MKNKPQKTLCFLILLLTVMIANSCRKDSNTSKLANNPEHLNTAKAWYEASYPFKGKKTTNGVNGDGVNFSQLIQPDWENADSYERFGDEVLEIPEDATAAIGVNINADSGVYKKEYSKTSFLLLKNNGAYQAFVMTIIAEAGYIGNDPGKLDSNKYNKRDENFSGMVLYSTPDGQFVNGWLYKDGNITGRLRTDEVFSGINGSVKKGKKIQTVRVNTYTTAVTYCTDWYQMVEGAWVYLDSQCHTTFIETSGGGGGSSGGGGGGASGGGGGTSTGPPHTTPCDPVPATVIKNSTGGGLKTNGNAPANPGGGGFPPPTTPPPCDEVPVITEIKTDSLNMKYPCAVKLIINKLLTINGYKNLISPFQTNGLPNLTWKNNTLPWSSTGYMLGTTKILGNENSATIELNNSMLQNSSQLLIATAAIHETLHATINYNMQGAYYNVVDNNVTSGSWMFGIASWYTIKGLPTNYSNHYIMMEGYFDQAVSILKTWDNSAHTSKQYQMAMLYGLDNIGNIPNTQPNYNVIKNRLQSFYNNLSTKYGITSNDITTFYKSQLKANASEKLPTTGCN